MANKVLTAKVQLKTRDAESALKRLNTQINNINKAVNKTKATNLEKQLSRCGTQATKLRTKLGKVNSALSRTNATANKVKTTLGNANTKLTSVRSKTQQWASAQRSVNSGLKSSNTMLSSISSKLKAVAGMYLGIQGAGAIIKTSDKITSAQNRLNNLEGGSPELTNETMDKIYGAAMRSRSSYTDMLSNVSKTMTLAGDSFQGNIDNAIRFQEIMSKAYTVGGASATEASTSMYQLVQALGSGVLQGDELRSVREGAPLAYKAIEKFAQGVYDTEESLKDLASQGKITAEMVTAAIMDADFSGKIDEQFKKTQMTFGQAWDNIKSITTKAFEPVLEKLTKILNHPAITYAINAIGQTMVWLADGVLWVFDVLAKFFSWCADNWEWLKYVVGGVILVIIALFVKWAAIAIWNALVNIASFVAQYWGLLLIVAGIMAILYVYELWRQGAIITTEAIIYCLTIITVAALVAGIILNAMWLIWVAIALAVIALVIMYFSELCGYINVGIQAIVNAWFWCGNLIFGIWNWCVTAIGNGIDWIRNVFWGCVNWISALWNNCIAGIVNVAMGLWNSISAIAQNIGIAFSNAWNGAMSSFWNFIASCVEGLDWLAKPLEAIAELFGKSFNYESFASGLRDKANSYTQKEYVSVSDAWKSGMNTKGYQDLGNAWSSGYSTYSYSDLGDAWNKGWNTYDVFQDGWASDAYDTGHAWGQGVEDMVNEWGSQFQNKDSSYGGLFEDLSKMAGLDKALNGLSGKDLGSGINGLPDPNSPLNDVKGAWDEPSRDKLLSGVEDIKDELDIADDDLDWLRKIAEMEWRNEFTTAEIKVDMTNHNTVSGERDLDGIVEYLSDVLRAEMTSVAEGVHY